MKHTIYLSAERTRLTTDGVVETEFAGPGVYDSSWMPSEYVIGTNAVLWSQTDVSPNAIRSGRNKPQYYLDFYNLDGIPGNSDHRIRRLTGWRGTTDNHSVDAHGLCAIRRIRQLPDGRIAVTVESI